MAAVLAWQALAAPALAGWMQSADWLRSALGGTVDRSAASVAVFTVASLIGGVGLYLLIRRLDPARRAIAPAVDGADADAEADADADGNDVVDLWLNCETQLLALAHALPIGVLVVSDGRITSANPVALRQLQLDAAELSSDGSVERANAPGHRAAEPSAVPLFADPAVASAALAGALPPTSSVQLRRGDGEVFRAELCVHELTLGRRQCRLLLFNDRSERDRLDSRLQQQHEQLQAVTGRLITVQEDERRTLSRELHDDIGQAITAIKLGAVALADDDATRREIVDEIIDIADQTVAKLRDLSRLLRPPQLDALGLEAAVRWQAQAMFRGAQPALELMFTALPQRPSPAVELACFRIVQEALTNVLRHAGATQVRVSLGPDAGMLALCVSDDGCGFAPGDAGGLGLVIMRERAHLSGGSLAIESAPGEGTRVEARLPMPAADGA